jgi:hypothetical protein
MSPNQTVDACTSASPPTSLASLPQDVLLKLAWTLEGPDVAALESSCSELQRAFTGMLSPKWQALHCEIDEGFELEERGASPQEDRRCKVAFAHAWAQTQQRCPRCGKRGRLPVLGNMPGEEPFLDQSRYLHLCDWLTPG